MTCTLIHILAESSSQALGCFFGFGPSVFLCTEAWGVVARHLETHGEHTHMHLQTCVLKFDDVVAQGVAAKHVSFVLLGAWTFCLQPAAAPRT